MGLDSLVWIPGFALMGSDSWVSIPRFGSLGEDSWVTMTKIEAKYGKLKNEI